MLGGDIAPMIVHNVLAVGAEPSPLRCIVVEAGGVGPAVGAGGGRVRGPRGQGHWRGPLEVEVEV